jgi:hypothetical protein
MAGQHARAASHGEEVVPERILLDITADMIVKLCKSIHIDM